MRKTKNYNKMGVFFFFNFFICLQRNLRARLVGVQAV